LEQGQQDKEIMAVLAAILLVALAVVVVAQEQQEVLELLVLLFQVEMAALVLSHQLLEHLYIMLEAVVVVLKVRQLIVQEDKAVEELEAVLVHLAEMLELLI
jgi:hypothetical protein